jgi:peptidoglycan/LPS O-acetylase OafA/YrhL
MRFVHKIVPSILSNCSGAVHIFFAVSGFVITLSLKNKLLKDSEETCFLERLRSSKEALISFYQRRFFRVCPVMLLTAVLVGVYLELSANDRNWLFPLLRAPIEVLVGVYNNSVELFVTTEKIHYGGFGPFWTLAVEAQFYITWPLVLLLCKNNNIRSLVALSLGCLFLLVIQPLHDAFYGTKYYLTYGNLSELFLGSFLAFLYTNDSEGKSGTGLKLISLLLAAVIWCYPSTLNKSFFSGTAVSLASVLITAMAVFFRESFNFPLFGRIFDFLGSRSFSFYAVQLTLANMVDLYVKSIYFPKENFSENAADLYQFVIFIVTLFAVTELTWRFVEKPLVKLGRKYFGERI